MRAASNHVGRNDWTRLWQHYDKDGSGGLDFREFCQAVLSHVTQKDPIAFDEHQLWVLFQQVDVDSDGAIDVHEFTNVSRESITPVDCFDFFVSLSSQLQFLVRA